ncbi:MAG TPA: zinc metalloprotease [Luteibaculaceae bacterium]|nr:zinc metalloprotease [Luteibaculaceae bacterium]
MRVFLLFSALFVAAFASGQGPGEPCLAQIIDQKTRANHRLYLEDLQHKIASWAANRSFAKNQSALLQIPVVFHVVYNPTQAGSNLSRETLLAQLDVLNEDFRRLNADTALTREVFKGIAADLQIEFVIAQRDPEGNPTDGVTRTESLKNFNVFVFPDDVKYNDRGGKDAWPAGEYLNFWTCDMSLIATQFVIGYAQFPGGNPETDGIVVQWQYVGRPSASGGKGRTATHEVGHWLGLRHIWGDGNCAASDFVDDTPNAAEAHYGCLDVNSCSEEHPFWNGQNPPDMTENYMDYSDDACMNSFTAGQRARAQFFLENDSLRKALFTSKGGQAPEGTGITAVSNEPKARLFPNPGSGFYIQGVQPHQIAVRDLAGRSVSYSGNGDHYIDMSAQPGGIYFVEVTDREGKVSRLRWIKD